MPNSLVFSSLRVQSRTLLKLAISAHQTTVGKGLRKPVPVPVAIGAR